MCPCCKTPLGGTANRPFFKTMRIIFGINTLNTIEQPIYSSHVNFFYRVGKDYPDSVCALNTPRRMGIDRMRNQTAKFALEGEFDYLMFVDDDVSIPTDALKKLLACDADIAAAWTIIRGYPFQNMFFRHVGGDKNTLENYPTSDFEPGTVVPCDAIGFSCVLIKTSLLKKVPPPWFVTGTSNTEDIYFCMKARHLFPETSIVVDTSIQTSHAIGTEFIGPDNLVNYKKYCEETYPDLYIPKEVQDERDKIAYGDRGLEYLEMVKAGEMQVVEPK